MALSSLLFRKVLNRHAILGISQCIKPHQHEQHRVQQQQHRQSKSFFSKDSNINSSHATDSKNDNIRGLTKDEKEFLEKNGYLLIKNFVPKEVAINLQHRMMKLLTDFDENSTKSVFSSHRKSQQYKDTYFLNSGHNISYFWEENVFDENTGLLNREKQNAINKVGHALHTQDEYFHSYVYGYLPQIVFDVGMKDPVALQSMYICKQPGVGGEVTKHQDTPFLFTEPHSCHGFWLAIDGSDVTNGCIWVAPGSHKTAGLRSRFRRISDEETEMKALKNDGKYDDYDNDGVAVPCDTGDLIILHGELVHWSDANKSDVSRHALMMHCVDNACQYPSDNWLQYPNSQPFPKFTQKDIENQPQTRKAILNAQF